MDGIDPAVWSEVERAAALAGVDPAEFAQAALARASEAALADVSIYALRDPRTNEIRYVGQSRRPDNRMKAHRRDKDGSARAQWVSELKGEGLEPQCEIVSVVPAAEADWSEQWFIDGFRGDGHQLLNVRQVFDLPAVELRLIPPTYEWVCRQAERDGCSPAHIFEKAIVPYIVKREEADHAAC